MNSPRPGLRIVPYSSSDFSLGEALAAEDGTTSTDPRFVGNSISLYLQWERHRSARVYPGDSRAHAGFQVEISCDPDERIPTELHLAVTIDPTIAPNAFAPFQEIQVRFEVFRTCFEFTVSVLAVLDRSKGEQLRLIATVPGTITSYRSRRLPRVPLADSDRVAIPEARWAPDTHGPDHGQRTLRILELGMRSLVAEGSSIEGSGSGTISFGRVAIRATVAVRRATKEKEPDRLVFQLQFESSVDVGRYFDIYRRVAYPALRWRHDFPYGAGIDLYYETGYFSKFHGEKSDSERKELADVWEATRSGTHETTADYYIVDDSGTLIGCSSAVLAFFNKETPVWAFHQLCAKRKPELLARSGQLYAWRAEYLASRVEELEAIVWFDGRSRWLERIYVKFALQSESRAALYPVQTLKRGFESSSKPSPLRFRLYSIGAASRAATTESAVLAGAGPRFLNAAENLSGIAVLGGNLSPDMIVQAGEGLAEALGEPIRAKITVPHDYDLQGLSGDPQVEDRVCHFPKAELVGFLASVEHSMAVTERKLDNSGSERAS